MAVIPAQPESPQFAVVLRLRSFSSKYAAEQEKASVHPTPSDLPLLQLLSLTAAQPESPHLSSSSTLHLPLRGFSPHRLLRASEPTVTTYALSSRIRSTKVRSSRHTWAGCRALRRGGGVNAHVDSQTGFQTGQAVRKPHPRRRQRCRQPESRPRPRTWSRI